MSVSSDEQHDGGAEFFQHDCLSSGEVQGRDDEVDGLDADERDDDAAEAVDQQVAPQQRAGADRRGRRRPSAPAGSARR